MATAATRYFRRLSQRLTEDIDDLDTKEMVAATEASGGRPATEFVRGQEITMIGRLRTVSAGSRGCAAAMEAELWDGHDTVTVVWLGRRRIPGLEPGCRILVRGRLGDRDGTKVLYNPYYELQGER